MSHNTSSSSLLIKAFSITPGVTQADDEAYLSNFLQGVKTQQINTSFADGRWQILVIFEDKMRDEEREQIRKALFSALKSWRDKHPQQGQIKLADSLLHRVADTAPTTEVELRWLMRDNSSWNHQFDAEIAAVIRQCLDMISGD